MSHMTGDSESDIVEVEPPTGGDWSDIQGLSNDESEGQMPYVVACRMETMHRELKEPSNSESERTQR